MPQNTSAIAEVSCFACERVVGGGFGHEPGGNLNDFQLTAAFETYSGSGVWHLEAVNAGPGTMSMTPIAFCAQTLPQ
jgi:hypothetical protein